MTASALKVADAAAADAASDARAEALKEAAAEAKKTSRKKPAKSAGDGWDRLVVDIWITDFNFTEFGVYKHTRNRAKSRQFTTDMDIFGEIIENGERTGLFGYREDAWKKAQGMDKRLVIKLFTEKLNWRATMDLMIGRSLQQTIGARGLPVMTYSINTDDDIDFCRLQSTYAGPMSYLDAGIGVLFEELERHGLTNDCLVLVTSDHGQALTRVSTPRSLARARRFAEIAAVTSGFSIGRPPPPPEQ